MSRPTDLGDHRHDDRLPSRDMKAVYAFITKQTRRSGVEGGVRVPGASTCSRTCPTKLDEAGDPVDVTLDEMDRSASRRGMIGAGDDARCARSSDHPDRFIAVDSGRPERGHGGGPQDRARHEKYGARAVGMFPAGCYPQVPINDKRMYPIYAKCVELDIPVFVLRRRARAAAAVRLPARRAASTRSCTTSPTWCS